MPRQKIINIIFACILVIVVFVPMLIAVPVWLVWTAGIAAVIALILSCI